MTVLFDHQVFSYQSQGGVSRSFAELISGLERRGHRAVRGWAWSPNRYLPGPDLLGRHTFRGKAAVRAWLNRGVSRKMLGQAFDVFHPTYYDPYFLPSLKGRPFVLTIHDMTHELFPEGLSDAHLVPERKRFLAGLAARVIAVSEHTRADAVRLLGLDPDKVVVVPHGNSLRPGNVAPVLPAIPGRYWLYVGSRQNYKDFPVLVEALGLRRAAGRGERLVMVGGGSVSMEERNLLARHGLETSWAQVDCSEAELAGWYSQAWALVYPSRYEGFGMPLLEAMAWGCPVIAAGASSLPEVGGNAVLYFEAGQAADLAARMEALEDEELRSGLVREGRQREAGFTWSAAVDQILAVYRSVAGERMTKAQGAGR